MAETLSLEKIKTGLIRSKLQQAIKKDSAIKDATVGDLVPQALPKPPNPRPNDPEVNQRVQDLLTIVKESTTISKQSKNFIIRSILQYMLPVKKFGKALEMVWTDTKLTLDELEDLVADALPKPPSPRPSDQEVDARVDDLLAIVKESTTISKEAKQRIRRTILQYMLPVKRFGKALEKVCRDTKLSLDELDDLLTVALPKPPKPRPNDQEVDATVDDLLAIVKESTTINKEAKQRIRRTILQYMLPVKKFGKALEKVCTDGKLTWNELKGAVRETLVIQVADAVGIVETKWYSLPRDDKAGIDQINDLLNLSTNGPKGSQLKKPEGRFRRYILGLLLACVKSAPQPATEPSQSTIPITDGQGTYNFTIIILADRNNALNLSNPGHTEGQFNNYQFYYNFLKGRVTSFTQWPRCERITIQTSYRPNVDPSSISGYGRGTTGDDILKGNTSLGFHESSHRKEIVNYVRGHVIPTFQGRVGMTIAQVTKAFNEFKQKLKAYRDDLDRFHRLRVDSVGYTKQDHDKDTKAQATPLQVFN